ncbi:MAG: hypothetical protein COU51_02390, partial [Parcubacteria group bacterium CG10_big_fil_rev_8_21_14_0_10_36_14]
LMDDWKTDAENGGIIEGNETIGEDTSLGPIKINGDLNLVNNATLTIEGTVYVTGNITFNNNINVELASSYENKSGIIIADGTITLKNNILFSGAGDGSYIILISALNDTVNDAIVLYNYSDASILYAPHGIINLVNNVSLHQASAYKLNLSNNVELHYETGLTDISFSSGPSGGWSKIKGTWQIIE